MTYLMPSIISFAVCCVLLLVFLGGSFFLHDRFGLATHLMGQRNRARTLAEFFQGRMAAETLQVYREMFE